MSDRLAHKEQIKHLMSDEKERTLQQISDIVHIPTQSVGARLRELRQEGYIVSLRKIPSVQNLVYLYRVIEKYEN